jgi:hypothetical protein
LPQPRKARCGAQFPGLRLLRMRDVDGLLKSFFRFLDSRRWTLDTKSDHTTFAHSYGSQ